MSFGDPQPKAIQVRLRARARREEANCLQRGICWNTQRKTQEGARVADPPPPSFCGASAALTLSSSFSPPLQRSDCSLGRPRR